MTFYISSSLVFIYLFCLINIQSKSSTWQIFNRCWSHRPLQQKFWSSCNYFLLQLPGSLFSVHILTFQVRSLKCFAFPVCLFTYLIKCIVCLRCAKEYHIIGCLKEHHMEDPRVGIFSCYILQFFCQKNYKLLIYLFELQTLKEVVLL